jgi:hypothetical protein
MMERRNERERDLAMPTLEEFCLYNIALHFAREQRKPGPDRPDMEEMDLNWEGTLKRHLPKELLSIIPPLRKEIYLRFREMCRNGPFPYDTYAWIDPFVLYIRNDPRNHMKPLHRNIVYRVKAS